MGSRSSSQANQQQNTSNVDRRLANDGGIVATEGASIFTNSSTSNAYTDSSQLTLNTLDGGAINRAFDFATNIDATLGEGVSNVLNFARDNDRNLSNGLGDLSNSLTQGYGKLLDFANSLTTKTQDNATALSGRYQSDVLQAFDSAKGAAGNGIDQKTLIILGVSAAAVLVMINRKP